MNYKNVIRVWKSRMGLGESDWAKIEDYVKRNKYPLEGKYTSVLEQIYDPMLLCWKEDERDEVRESLKHLFMVDIRRIYAEIEYERVRMEFNKELEKVIDLHESEINGQI